VFKESSGLCKQADCLSCSWRHIAELEKDWRRLDGLQYNLTFLNVTMEDAQVIQCNVSNKHDYIFTNAYLNVHSQYRSVF